MPIYEYECEDCGHHLDALQKISEPVLVNCPACRKDGLKKLVSAPRFRLKGSGWYETDFKKDKRRNIAGDGGDPGAGAKADGAAKKASEPGSSDATAKATPAAAGKAAAEKKPAAKTDE